MRTGVAWTGAKAELFDEAMRVVPAIARHRSRQDRVSTNATLLGFQRQANDMGIDVDQAWAVMVSAYMTWVQNLFEVQAEFTHASMENVLNAAVGAAAEWVAEP